MKYKILLLLVVGAFCEEMLITREYEDYLRKRVSWEVEDYERNIFRGWTVEEAKSLLGLTSPELDNSLPEVEHSTRIPSQINWRGSGCDHTPLNQGSCGSCWAFATAGMLSDRCCILASDKGWLSPQELVSCDKGSLGCYGGSLSSPITYMQKNGGLVSLNCFPYHAQNVACPTTCTDGSSFASAHVCKCTSTVNCYGTLGIKNCLIKGPVPIAFTVCQSFMYYKSGIYKCDCTNYIGGHATLVMGYGSTPECNFYVKNSWGPYWGIQGYFNIACSTCNLTGGTVCATIS